uniref:hypothetical protein n=1 Tax=Myxosarcina sp. GI1 TaxID=1541065 RepID=UPI0005686FC2
GCRFPFYCFVDEELRNLQFELINADLEQAVGRSRLVITDATVLVAAGFPLKQSQLITKDDWKEIHHELQATQSNELQIDTPTEAIAAETTLAQGQESKTDRSDSNERVIYMDSRAGKRYRSEESEISKQFSIAIQAGSISTTEENIVALLDGFNFKEMNSELLNSILATEEVTQELINAAWKRLTPERQYYLTSLLENQQTG